MSDNVFFIFFNIIDFFLLRTYLCLCVTSNLSSSTSYKPLLFSIFVYYNIYILNQKNIFDIDMIIKYNHNNNNDFDNIIIQFRLIYLVFGGWWACRRL